MQYLNFVGFLFPVFHICVICGSYFIVGKLNGKEGYIFLTFCVLVIDQINHIPGNI